MLSLIADSGCGLKWSSAVRNKPLARTAKW